MKRVICIFVIAVSQLLSGQSPRMSRSEYIASYSNLAIKEMAISGIPASITLAQACLESGNGNSYLAREGNNHFGIKCHGWNGKTIRHTDDAQNECFRKYEHVEESFRDHSDFLRYWDRYAFLFDLEPHDYKGWCYGLKKAGYATAPNYAELLIAIIEEHSLYQYDTVSLLPPSPTEAEVSVRIHPQKGSPLYRVSLYREVYSRNKVAYIIATEYDTFKSLAKEYNLFKFELYRFNDLDRKDRITPGMVIYLEKKRKESAKHLDRHVVEEDESLWSISQRYGVRMKFLRKYNNLAIGTEPLPGSIINLRKKTR